MWRSAELMGYDEGRTTPLAAVEDAVRWGADAVLTYLFVGLNDPGAEAEEIRRNAQVNRACERFGIVHIIESMARGQRVGQVNRKDLVAMHVRIASEMGADLIKTDFLDTEEDTVEVVGSTWVPLLLAGGLKIEDARALDVVERSIRSGVAGVIFGRNVFQAADPGGLLRAIGAIVHGSGRGASSCNRFVHATNFAACPGPSRKDQ